jgi:hypothetical protein
MHKGNRKLKGSLQEQVQERSMPPSPQHILTVSLPVLLAEMQQAAS